MKYLKKVYRDPDTELWVASTKFQGKFFGKTPLKACRFARRAFKRKVEYVNQRVNK